MKLTRGRPRDPLYEELADKLRSVDTLHAIEAHLPEGYASLSRFRAVLRVVLLRRGVKVRTNILTPNSVAIWRKA